MNLISSVCLCGDKKWKILNLYQITKNSIFCGDLWRTCFGTRLFAAVVSIQVCTAWYFLSFFGRLDITAHFVRIVELLTARRIATDRRLFPVFYGNEKSVSIKIKKNGFASSVEDLMI